MNAEDIVNGISRLIESSKGDHRGLVVFDLDSTLYDVSGRTQQILRDFANQPEIVAQYPQEAKVLSEMEIKTSDWGIKEALIRNKVTSTLDFFEKVRLCWVEHFFDSTYLHKDVSYPGAVDFVQSIHQSNIPIVYLTGRGDAKMRPGTIKSLGDTGFPVPDGNQVKLVMKGENDGSDEFFKRDELAPLVKQFNEIWFFENEPVIIQLIEKDFPSINMVFFKSVHSGKAQEPGDTLCLGTRFPSMG